MSSSRDALARLGPRVVSGYNAWLLVTLVSGVTGYGIFMQWFFPPNSSAAYSGNDIDSMQSKNPVLIAYTMEKHLTPGYNNWLNDYDLSDPVLQPAINEWKQECGNICLSALPPGVEYTGDTLTSCNPGLPSDGCSTGLQCAMFVHTVFALTDNPLPAGGNAIDYWGEAPYSTGADGWQEFYNGVELPQPGDLALWNNDPYSSFGHIAIVVSVQLPQGGSNGTVLLAQANGLGNSMVYGADLLSAPLAPDNKVEVWGWNVPAKGWNGFEFTGFIHNTSMQYENLATLLASVSSSTSTGGYSIVGPPTITADSINTILANAHSPAAGTGQYLYSLGVTYGIDPVFALAFFQEESSFGTAGVAAITHSLGNMRCMPQYKCYVDPKNGGYASFDTWQQGYEVWYQLISGPDYVGAGLTTVEQIVPKYAPSADHNNVAQYIQNIEKAVDEWRSGQ